MLCRFSMPALRAAGIRQFARAALRRKQIGRKSNSQFFRLHYSDQVCREPRSAQQLIKNAPVHGAINQTLPEAPKPELRRMTTRKGAPMIAATHAELGERWLCVGVPLGVGSLEARRWWSRMRCSTTPRSRWIRPTQGSLSKAALDAIQLREKTVEQAISSAKLKIEGQEGRVHGIPGTAGYVSVLVQHRDAMRMPQEAPAAKVYVRQLNPCVDTTLSLRYA